MAETAAASTPAKTPAHKTHFAEIIISVGLLMLALFIVVLITQIQTTEAYILHQGEVSIFRPDWGIVMQIPALFSGSMTSDQAIATIVGWGVELLFLGMIVGYEIIKEAVHAASGVLMGRIFRSVSWVIVAFCAYTDSVYGTVGSGLGGHIAFAAICAIIIGYFGTVGWTLVSYGWKRI